MADSLTVPIYLNVRKRPVPRNAEVRLKGAVNCDFRHTLSIKLANDRLLLTAPPPPPKTPTPRAAIPSQNPTN